MFAYIWVKVSRQYYSSKPKQSDVEAVSSIFYGPEVNITYVRQILTREQII